MNPCSNLNKKDRSSMKIINLIILSLFFSLTSFKNCMPTEAPPATPEAEETEEPEEETTTPEAEPSSDDATADTSENEEKNTHINARKSTIAYPPKYITFTDISSTTLTVNWSANNNPSYVRYGILRSTDNFAT